jgi:ABC-type transport system involved in multi-copper enzyme maturation permease subunit
MKEKLTAEDIRLLKYSCRPGILTALGFFVILLFILFASYLNDESIIANRKELIVVIGLLIFTPIILGFSMIRKYLIDINSGEKELIEKKVQKKLFYIDYEPGSGSLFIGQKMKAFESYNLVIEGKKYNVEKELFEKTEEDGTVFFHIAPVSDELLKIDLK